MFAEHVNGLAGAASGDGLYLNLARRSGGSSVRIELLDGEPAVADGWEDIVEVSIVVPDAPVRWETWGGESGGDLTLPAGTYRVRVHAHGRDAGRGGELAERIVDRYLLKIWPAQAGPDAIVKTTSKDAEYWHREIGSRR